MGGRGGAPGAVHGGAGRAYVVKKRVSGRPTGGESFGCLLRRGSVRVYVCSTSVRRQDMYIIDSVNSTGTTAQKCRLLLCKSHRVDE